MSKPAFPNIARDMQEGEIWRWTDGLTKREYAAIHIAAALASRGVTFTDDTPIYQRAVALADAVLAEAGK